MGLPTQHLGPRVLAAHTTPASHPRTHARALTLVCRVIFFAADLEGGAYPLQTIDILAIAALVWIITTAFKAVRNRLDRAPIVGKKTR